MNKAITDRSSSLQKRALKIKKSINEALAMCDCTDDPLNLGSCLPSSCPELKKQLAQLIDIIHIQSKSRAE